MSIFLYAAMAVLIADGVIELGFITATVGWLHRTAGAGFEVNNAGDSFLMAGKPKNFLLNQGHASNGAAGTAFIVVGFGGIIALYLRHRQLRRSGHLHGFTAFFYNFWLVMTILSAIYSLASFVYVFVETYQHDNQSINLGYLSRLNNQPYPKNVPYDLLEWTPQNWFPAVLRLPLADDSQRSDIQFHLNIMKGWQWNLIPMTILGFIVMVLAVIDKMRHRNHMNKTHGAERLEAARQKPDSPWA